MVDPEKRLASFSHERVISTQQCSVSMKLRIYAVAVGSWMREQDDKMSDLMSNPYLNFSRVEAEGCMNS